jgi:hypothetical protein
MARTKGTGVCQAPGCSNPVHGQRPWQAAYCSRACDQKAYRERHKALGDLPKRIRRKGLTSEGRGARVTASAEQQP